jgi:hypothetical protein
MKRSGPSFPRELLVKKRSDYTFYTSTLARCATADDTVVLAYLNQQLEDRTAALRNLPHTISPDADAEFWFQQLEKYHPGTLEYLVDETRVRDPEDIWASNVADIMNKRPKTDGQRYLIVHNQFVKEWPTLPDVIAYRRRYQIYKTALSAAKAADNKIKRFVCVAQMLNAEQVHLAPGSTEYLDRLLLPLNAPAKLPGVRELCVLPTGNNAATAAGTLVIKRVACNFDSAQWEYPIFIICERSGKSIEYARLTADACYVFPWLPREYVLMLCNFLEQLVIDPKTALGFLGRTLGRCCVCGKVLSDDKSIELGYGRQCIKYAI